MRISQFHRYPEGRCAATDRRGHARREVCRKLRVSEETDFCWCRRIDNLSPGLPGLAATPDVLLSACPTCLALGGGTPGAGQCTKAIAQRSLAAMNMDHASSFASGAATSAQYGRGARTTPAASSPSAAELPAARRNSARNLRRSHRASFTR